MNVRRLAEAIAQTAILYRSLANSSAAETSSISNQLTVQENEIAIALDLNEVEAQRFRAHFQKELYGK